MSKVFFLLVLKFQHFNVHSISKQVTKVLNLQVKHLGIRHDKMRQIVIFKRLLINILPLFVCTGLKSFTINGPLLFKSSFMKKKLGFLFLSEAKKVHKTSLLFAYIITY